VRNFICEIEDREKLETNMKINLKITQELKQVYFHAGRASAGARDYLAVEAYKRYQKLERK